MGELLEESDRKVRTKQKELIKQKQTSFKWLYSR